MEKDCCTFEVADTPVSSDRLPASPARRAIFDLLTRDSQMSTNMAWEYAPYVRQSVAQAQSAPSEPKGIEVCSHEDRLLMTGVSFHLLVFAAHACFCCHYPLTLSPDMIWLMIVQGVAEHINANSERLRPQFVQHRGRLLLELHRDDLVRGLPNQSWREVIAEFVAMIRTHVGDRRQIHSCSGRHRDHELPGGRNRQDDVSGQANRERHLQRLALAGRREDLLCQRRWHDHCPESRRRFRDTCSEQAR